MYVAKPRRCDQKYGEYIYHLQFAGYIDIMAETLQNLQRMLNDLADFSVCITVQMNLDNTKVMFTDHALPEPVSERRCCRSSLKICIPRTDFAVG